MFIAVLKNLKFKDKIQLQSLKYRLTAEVSSFDKFVINLWSKLFENGEYGYSIIKIVVYLSKTMKKSYLNIHPTLLTSKVNITSTF